MTKAIAVFTTRSKNTPTHPARLGSIPGPAPKRAPDAFITDLSAFPDEYALRVTGTCMEPLLLEKSKALFSKTATWKIGDIVAVWFRPEALGPDDLQASVKKLTMAPPFYVRAFPFRDHPGSNVAAVICVESLNPRRRLIARCADILAIHKLVSAVNDGGEITSDAVGKA